MQTLEVIKVCDYVFQVLPRIPDKMETERAGIVVQECHFGIIVGRYL